uniref:Splicing factor n=1 Tax=Tanacetum cinerariifolium TaxID=118510 RepID=A0A6L2KTX6_TANCI|nr:splicing factor [Tanacetum cinerariifolium]
MGRDANKAASENDTQVTKHGKQIRCSNCQGVGHNKASCENPYILKHITIVKKVLVEEENQMFNMLLQNVGAEDLNMGIEEQWVLRAVVEVKWVLKVVVKVKWMLRVKAEVLMDEDDIKKSMEDEHMQGLLVEQEDLRQKQEKEHQDKLDEDALQQAREEDLIFKRMDLEMEKEEQQ